MERTSGLPAFMADLLLSEGLYCLAPPFNAKIKPRNTNALSKYFTFVLV
jgi:hypothetical protein